MASMKQIDAVFRICPALSDDELAPLESVPTACANHFSRCQRSSGCSRGVSGIYTRTC
jgi:hypothetical protein